MLVLWQDYVVYLFSRRQKNASGRAGYGDNQQLKQALAARLTLA